MDTNKLVVLVMLHLSAAFDTVNYEVLLELSFCLEISAVQGLPYSGSDHTSQIGSGPSESKARFRAVYQ